MNSSEPALGENVLVSDQDRMLAAEDLGSVPAAEGSAGLGKPEGQHTEQPREGQQGGDRAGADEDQRAGPEELAL